MKYVYTCMSKEHTLPENVSDLPLEERMNYPGEWFFEDQEEKRNNRIEELEEELPESDVVGIVDTDSDGLACHVVLEQAFGENKNLTVIQGDGGEYGFQLMNTLQLVGEHVTPDTEVIIADLAPDSDCSPFVAGLAHIDATVRVIDHHDWEWHVKESMRGVSHQIRIGGDDMCAAQVLQEEILPNPSDTISEFLEVTADNDLWIKEDPRSDHLSTLSFNMDAQDYVEAAQEYGADMVEKDSDIKALYNDVTKRSDRKVEIATERATFKTINGESVAFVYGDCYHSQVGDNLINEGADLVVIVKPRLKLSFRASDDLPIASTLAKKFKNGGGHPKAAGANIYSNVSVPDDTEHTKLEYVWDNEGEPALEFMEEFLHKHL